MKITLAIKKKKKNKHKKRKYKNLNNLKKDNIIHDEIGRIISREMYLHFIIKGTQESEFQDRDTL